MYMKREVTFLLSV